jgi:hypothetical protein
MYSVCPIIRAKEWIQHSTQAETKLHQWLINRPNREIRAHCSVDDDAARRVDEWVFLEASKDSVSQLREDFFRPNTLQQWLTTQILLAWGKTRAYYLLFLRRTTLVGQYFIPEASRSHTDTPHWVGHPWTRDHLVADNTKHTRDKHPCPRPDLNLKFLTVMQRIVQRANHNAVRWLKINQALL